MTKKRRFFINFPVYLVIVMLGGFVVMQLFLGSSEQLPPPDSKTVVENNFYAAKQPLIPEKLEFAGESVPLHLYDVRESLDREMITNSYYHSSTIQILKRAERYFPYIDSVLKANNIPEDFKYLCVIESSLKNTTSPAGAKGFWQFMKSTGREHGLEINSYVDERYSLEKSTQAACEYLQEAYDIFGSWTLAAAAYNMGKSGLKRHVNEQRVDNYYDLYLNAETARYVYRILAMKTIMPDHESYGFMLKTVDKYAEHKHRTLIVDTTITDLVNFAFQQGVNYKILKEFNPWLTNTFLTNRTGREYKILLPDPDVRPCKPAVPQREKE
ncbi:MAG: lytic transglycosylase domain-containing protein [Bacteroidales bacterium]